MRMFRNHFQELATNILNKVRKLKKYDYAGAMKVSQEMRSFILEHKGFVNELSIEGIDRAKPILMDMTETNNIEEKEKLWDKGIMELIYVIQSVRNENTYPDSGNKFSN